MDSSFKASAVNFCYLTGVGDNEVADDFPVSEIRVNSGTEKWGPFSFDFTNALPVGSAIQTATVSAISAEGIDSSALINSSSVVGLSVLVYFNFPGAAYVGEHFLIFTLVLETSSAAQVFTFKSVLVED